MAWIVQRLDEAEHKKITGGEKMETVHIEGINSLEGSIQTRTRPGWSVTGASGDNATQTLNRPAEAGKRHFIAGVSVSVSGAAAAVDVAVTLKDGASVIWQGFIGTGVRGLVSKSFEVPIACGEGNAVSLEVGPAGAGAITTANLEGYTV